MPELEVSSGSFLSQIVALDLTIRPPRKKPKRRQGAAQDERFALIFAHPTPSGPSGHLPLTGGVGPGPHFTEVTP